MYYLYILKSLKDNKRYIGSTNDLQRRLAQHNFGFVKSTKSRKPFVLLYSEKFVNEKDSRLREKYFKTHKGHIELRKILVDGV